MGKEEGAFNWTIPKGRNPEHRDYIVISFSLLIIKPTRCINSSNLFWHATLHVSDSSSVHHQEFFTAHIAMVYVSKPVWHITLLCVQWKTLDDGQKSSPKHVEFYSKNRFEKLVYLVGFIIKIYHHARSPERQIKITIRHGFLYARSEFAKSVWMRHNNYLHLLFNIRWVSSVLSAHYCTMTHKG